MNYGEKKIPVGPIEQQIQHYFGVSEVCIFSQLTRHGEDELVIAIEAERMPKMAKLKSVASSFPLFKTIRFEPIKAFPRSSIGMRKVQRQVLRKMLER